MSAFWFTRARGLWKRTPLLCTLRPSPANWFTSTAVVLTMSSKSKLQKADGGKRGSSAVDRSTDAEEHVPDAKRKKSEPQEAEPVKKRGKQTKLNAIAKGSGEGSAGASKDSGESESKAKTDLSKMDFKLENITTKDGRPWNFKVCSWNVNGVRAWLKSNPMRYLEEESPDVICFQEVKCSEKDLPLDELEMAGYISYWSSAVDKKGYSGTGLLTKKKPLKVTFGMGIKEHDQEGRLIVAEYDSFYVIGCYVPNAGEKLKRLDYRMKWDKAFREYVKKLDELKPVIYCGDLNVAHNPIDLKNPKSNKNTAGFTQEERDSFSELLKQGFVDSFRHLYPELEGAYTYWSYRFNARAKNTGWRLDYFVLSERLLPKLCDNIIRKEVYGSDHCPLVLLMAMD